MDFDWLSKITIYSAFDVNPNTRLKTFYLSLLQLSQDDDFIRINLDLAKNKYCRAYQVNKYQVTDITPDVISVYLQMLADSFELNG